MGNIPVEEKAKKVAAAWPVKSGVLSPDGVYFESLCSDIELALKEQDRDTRHACAEAVLTAADPHAACINAKAV